MSFYSAHAHIDANFESGSQSDEDLATSGTIAVSSLCLILWVAITAYYGTWNTPGANWDLL